MKKIYLLFCFTLFATLSIAQIKIKPQLVYGLDLYQWYRNPYCSTCVNKEASSSGTSLISTPIGARVIIGKNNFSIATELGANFGWFTLDINQYKGVGSLAFPAMVKANFGALSGFSKNKLLGYSIGGGIQYSKTELYGLTKKYDHLERKFFPTYIGEIGFGGGISGMQVSWNTKIGIGPNHGMVIQNSIQFYMNFKKDKKSDSSTLKKNL